MAIEISIALNIFLSVALILKWMAYVALAERSHGQRARAERFATLAASLRSELARTHSFNSKPTFLREAKPASNPEVAPISEPSFERSEAEALQAQEKYYEPARTE